MHRQIRDQGLRRDYLANVKLGDGGIREIEFIVQALQIVRGGREPELRVKGTLPALVVLEARNLLPQSAVAALRDAYVFLRRTEHRLQYRNDQQTHQLPANADERALLAESMGFAALRDFDAELSRHRAQVSEQFAQIFGDSERSGASANQAFTAVWEEPEATATAREQLIAAGFTDPDALFATLARVRASGRYLQLPALSRQRFDTLMPQLLATSAANPGAAGAQEVFGRLLTLLEAVSRRSAYLALVIEHPPCCRVSRSSWAHRHGPRITTQTVRCFSTNCSTADRCWRSLTGPSGDAISTRSWRQSRAIRSGRWTPCATSSTRKPFACSRRMSMVCSPSSA